MRVKKKRSVKRKPPSSPEGCPPAQGKTLKVGTYPLPSSAAGVGDSSRGVNESPLEFLPISVWSPTSRGTAPPSTVPDEVTGNRNRSEAVGDEDSLLSHAELAVEVVSSILCDSGLRRAPCPSGRLWIFFFRESPLYIQVLSSIFFFIVSVRVAESLSFFFFF